MTYNPLPENGAEPKEKPKVGRPTDYIQKVHDKIAENLAGEGKIMLEIADSLGINIHTLYRWKKNNQSFEQALQRGLDRVDARVERALLKRAEGYEYNEKAKGNSEKQGAFVRVTTKEVAPDVGAQKLWLTNRQPEKWREKKEITGDPDRPFVLEVHHVEADI